MGAWSHEPFGNDTAGDWAYSLVESTDLSHIEATLDKVLQNKGYLEARDGEEAVAVVAVLAKILGKHTQSDIYTEEVESWIASLKLQPSADLLRKAQRVLQRVVSKDSELLELWTEGDEGDDWKKSIASLQSAVKV